MDKKSDKTRIDQLIVAQGLAESRTHAQELIRQGRVSIGGEVVQKSAATFPPETIIEVRGDIHPWVGRGGVKLDHALKEFSVVARNRICLDLGASTGGFTDVLLQHGARKVYAVDVGHGQLHEKLRDDARVVNLQGVHARDLTEVLVPEPVSLVVCDVSFISLKKALPSALALVREPGSVLVALIKPQFEAGRAHIGRGGIVRDEAVHRDICADVQAYLEDELRWEVQGIIKSPIAGGDGNLEYLLYALRMQ